MYKRQVLAHLNLNLGDAWMLLAVVVWAIYTVGLAWRPAGVHPMLMLGALIAVGLAALLPAYLWEMAQGRHINVYLGSLAAVSYTHLRAHETVLDIVCRLLLEKKKQQRTHITFLV